MFCCECTPRANFKSLYTKRASSLDVLDGMRFMAVLWVFCLHNGNNSYMFMKCLRATSQRWAITTNGDMGVDIFFVLSGFLISFVLKREFDKYGDIDWIHFMKLRFLRIYPGMMTYLGLALFVLPVLFGVDLLHTFTYVVPPMLFVNNFVPLEYHKTHLWSIAVEMQFYTLSPFLLKKMLRSEKPWMVPLTAFIFCTTMFFVVLTFACP